MINDYVYKDLRLIRYEPNSFEVDAFLGKEYVGSCTSIIAGNYPSFQQWKADLVKCLAARCRTVMLVTKCGCHKTMDLPRGYEDFEWRVDVSSPASLSVIGLHPAIESMIGNYRLFRFRKRFHETGIRLFEEV